MVFAKLRDHEKDAFFSLLDEYFASRPNLFANAGAHGDAGPAISAASMQRAVAANPDLAAKALSTGFKHLSSQRVSPGATPSPSRTPATESEHETTSVAGRIAAFARSNHAPASPSPPVAEKPSSLTTSKKFGDVDMSSTKAMFTSLTKKATPPAEPDIPPAFAPRQQSFAPPPGRRVASTVAAPPVRVPTPEPAPPPPAPPPPLAAKRQPAGEYVEALYDYDSGEAGDLKVTEGDIILLTERTSDDWWTGESTDGRKGLFPASYVKAV